MVFKIINLLWEQGVVSSNLTTPTSNDMAFRDSIRRLYFFSCNMVVTNGQIISPNRYMLKVIIKRRKRSGDEVCGESNLGLYKLTYKIHRVL